MSSKLLQGLGVVALIALVGGSLAALAVVKSRLRITVAEEQDAARRGPDPLAVLGDDVRTLGGEVRALGEGVGTQLQALHDALEGSAAERDAALRGELAQLRRELATLQARVEQSAAEVANSRARVDGALSRLGTGLQELASAVAEDAVLPVASAPVELPAVELPAVEPPLVVSAPVPELAAPPAVDSPPKKGFLSFKLPATGFVFDARQRFAIVPGLSRVGFDAQSTLHDFSGVTTQVEGEITVNPAHPDAGCGGAVSAQASSLDTGLAERDEALRGILEPAKFAELRFDWSAFEPTAVDAAALRIAGVAQGKLSIHGVARDLALPVTVTVDASKRLVIEGQTRIRLSDFGVRPPSKLGLISVEDEATLWIALRARTLGPAPEVRR